MLKRMAGLESYPLCLEIGCGRGIGAQIIAKQFGADKVIATDFDPEQIERAKRNLPIELKGKIDFRVADAMALDEPDEKFNAVFSFGVLHHTENWKTAIKEVSRVLKKGGEFFFEEPLRSFMRNLLIKTITAHPEGGEFDFEEFGDELKQNGIDITDIKHVSNIAIFGVGRKR